MNESIEYINGNNPLAPERFNDALMAEAPALVVGDVVYIIPEWFIWVMVGIALWSLVWKGVALWQAAQRGEKGWFVALLVVNTAGLLEILYLFYFGKKKEDDRDDRPQ